MRQTTLCVPLEVKPESCDRLTALIDALRHDEDLAGDVHGGDKPGQWIVGGGSMRAA